MRKLVLLVNSHDLRKFVLELDLEDLLRIFLQEMDSTQWWAFILEYSLLVLNHLVRGSTVGKAWHREATWCAASIKRRLRSSITRVAEASLSMSFQLFKRENLSASTGALESQMLEHFKHDPILWLHDIDFMADGAFKFLLINVTFAASFSESLQTVFASTRRAFATFIKIIFDHKTKLTFKILRDRINLIFWINV